MTSCYARGAGLGDATIYRLDTYRAAAVLVKRHGEDAPVAAEMRTDAMRRDAHVSLLAVTL